jgi:pSer/pThr/pTyr-binding forkhead associated (FHA) protein
MSDQEKTPPSPGLSRSSDALESVGIMTSLADGKDHPLGFGSLRIGRERRADLVITDKTVSRHHADIIYEGGRYVLYDHSSNGTWVNGNLVVVAHNLRDQDAVKFGQIEFVFSTQAVPKDEALRSGETTLPTKVPGFSTAVMKGGKARGGSGKLLKWVGVVALVLVLIAAIIYFALPDLADRITSLLPI